jgi:hypothetical protein
MKSKVLFEQEVLDFSYTHHNVYPILWPLNIAIQFAFWGDMIDPVAQWTSAIFFVVFIIQMIRGLQMIGIPGTVIHGMLVWLIISAYHNPLQKSPDTYLEYANAENIFLALVAGLLVSVMVALRSVQQREYRNLTVLLAVGLCLVKFEGGAAVICMIFALWLGVPALQNQIFYQRMVGLLWATLILPLGWMWWIKTHGYGSSIIHFQTGLSLEKACLLFTLLAKQFFANHLILMSLGAFCYLKIARPTRQMHPYERFLWYWGGALVIFACLANAGLSAVDLKRGLPEAFPRLFLHALPPLMMWWASRMFFHAKVSEGEKLP